MTERSVTERWSQFFLQTPYERMPADVVGQAKRALLDFLGVALGGASLPMARISADYYTALGGTPEASLLLDSRRVPAIHAAFVNGVYGHTLDMDDGHRLAGGHPGVATIPAALAAAEMEGASGRDLLRAIVFGYEVFVRIGAHLNPAHLRRGFHTTATVAPFAAAAASGILLGLNAERLTRALGLAGLQGAGLMEVFHDGAMAKPFQVGRATSAGLLAAQLAARGADGPRTILEGEQAFLGAMCGDRDASSLTDGLEDDWAIRGIYFKEHAACRHTHAPIDAARLIQDEHHLAPVQIERVLVRTYSTANQLCGATELPSGPSEAKFSLTFTVALGLTYGHARQSCFTPAFVADEGLRAIARRVRIEVDPDLERRLPQQRVSILEIVTTDGRTISKEVPFARGEPELPFTDADVEAKFLENAQAALPEAHARALAEQVWTLDTAPSCTALVDLLAGRAVAVLSAW